MTARRLVGEIGGTHARLAALDADGGVGESVTLPSAELRDLETALYAGGRRLGIEDLAGWSAAIAVAGPVSGETVALTNLGWRFSIEATRRAIGLERLTLLNDLEATALSLPSLADDELDRWRPGESVGAAPRVVLSVGTGLGVGILLRDGEPGLAAPSEGGHRDLAAADEREWRVVERLAERYGHASAERALSGPGLAALYDAVCELEGRHAEGLDAAGIGLRAAAGDDAACVEACRLFSGWLGAVAGDLVLTLGARGGLYLAGGVVAGMGPALDRQRFFARLQAKGRLSDYVERVSVHRIRTPDAALVGAARSLPGWSEPT